ncbi:MAG: OmpA family protein [bacterium]
MIKRIVLLLCITYVSFSMSGCLVKKGTYLKKVGEAEGLSKNVESLVQELEGMTVQNENLSSKIVLLESEQEQLSENNLMLTQSLGDCEREKKRLDESGTKKTGEINELWEKIAASEKEKIELQKSKELEVQEVSETYGDMLKKMEAEIKKGQVTITELKGKLTVNMLDAILFDSGQAEIRSEGHDVLKKVVEVLRQVTDKEIHVEGHTDNIPITGALGKKYPTNWELSAARAINVTKYLQNQGIDPMILSANAFGEYRPIASNNSVEGRAQNRRIEIILVPKD